MKKALVKVLKRWRHTAQTKGDKRTGYHTALCHFNVRIVAFTSDIVLNKLLPFGRAKLLLIKPKMQANTTAPKATIYVYEIEHSHT